MTEPTATKLGTKSAHLFGMPVNFLDLQESVDSVFALAADLFPNLVVTPNVDHFLRFHRDEEFAGLYKRAALSVLDGMPLVWLSRLGGQRNAQRVTGVDLFGEVCRQSVRNGISIAIVGGGPGVAELAASNLAKSIPGFQAVLVAAPTASELEDPHSLAALAARLNEHDRLVVALCLGSPKQERVFLRMAENLNGGAFLGVGAAVDFYAGKYQRAPLWAQKTGIEWLFRLFNEPKRLWRRYLVDGLSIFQYFLKAFGARSNVIAFDTLSSGRTGA